jgi:hypothetical protein
MKIETIELFGFVSAIKALRLPFKGKAKSDSITKSGFDFNHDDTGNIREGYNRIHSVSYLTMGSNDLRLLQNLIKNGDEHAKVVRGIIVSCSITAPRYWWQEMDTYKIGTERLASESTMHCEAKGLSGEELQRVKSELKEGHEQERIQWFSYQTLRRIEIQRNPHRLPEWKQFRDWIRTLPLAEELILVGLN